MISLKDVAVRFGGVVALDHINAEFTAPISGIIGPNGAGKTTTMNAVSGFLPYQGSVSYKGDAIDRLNPYKRTRWGLRRSFQREQIADDLTVVGNLWAILDNLPGDKMTKLEQVERAVEAMELTSIVNKQASQLNTYQRRLTDLARCVIGNPKVVMLDEPGGGLQKDETEHLGELILKIPELTDATTLVIDHDVDLITAICEETLVLDFGKRIAFGKTAEVLADPKVQAAYLGVEEVS
jgi:branched-chain amino acid transport system ATP-binding protein